MVNFPAPQKLDPKISRHGIHTVCDSVCGAGNGQFSCPTKTRPQDITPWYSHYVWQCLWGRKWSIFLPRKNSTPSPKIEPKPWYFRCLCKTQNNKRSKNTAICDTFATQHVRNAVFYSVFGSPSQKHWYLQCFVKTHAWNTVNTNEFKDYTFHGNKPQEAKTLIFTAFLRNDFSKKDYFWTILGFWSLPKQRDGGTPWRVALTFYTK